MSKVVVLGGGYAGLACLIELSKRDRSLELHLLDSQLDHCKITNLHKTFGRPLEKFTVPYARLADQFNFTFHHQSVAFTNENLNLWQREKKLSLPQAELTFDWLVVSTGASPMQLPGGHEALGQDELRRGEGQALFESLMAHRGKEAVQISLVGGGATGIQVLFELHEQLWKKRVPHGIRLVDLNQRLLPNYSEKVHRYIVDKMQQENIEYSPETRYLNHDEQQIHLEELATGRKYDLPSNLTLLFPGVAAHPFTLEANQFGQVIAERQVQPDIFSAGDCSHFNSPGLNLLTAQAAVRKGKLVARNICNLRHGKNLQKYDYQEKGYLISLGTVDAIGWLGLRSNLVKGLPAILAKETMETQYDLFLDGIDTYLGFP